jgi:hypothetical protein
MWPPSALAFECGSPPAVALLLSDCNHCTVGSKHTHSLAGPDHWPRLPAAPTSTKVPPCTCDQWSPTSLAAAPLQDGTLLDSSSRVLPSSVAAIRAAIGRGITVFLATGKARPAAIRAMQAVGLAGEGLVVSNQGPGIFLQGGWDVVGVATVGVGLPVSCLLPPACLDCALDTS